MANKLNTFDKVLISGALLIAYAVYDDYRTWNSIPTKTSKKRQQC